MRPQLCLSIAALALAGCAQTGQSPFEAKLSTEISVASVEGQATGLRLGEVAAALGAQPDLAQVEAAIPGNFIPPAEAPVPVPRPDYGDRRGATMLAQASPGTTQAIATTQVAAFAPAAAPTPAVTGASLAAYERREAGLPANPATNAQKPLMRNAGAVSRTAGRRWRPAYPHVRTECFPEKLRAALERIGDHFDADVLVTSGARKNGRRGSLHRACKAADIRVAGVSPRSVAQFAQKLPGVNGVGSYRWTALTHIDIRDERFAWRW